ncbi:MAG: hypothetical protein ABIX44_04990 [Cryobacterium sp.]
MAGPLDRDDLINGLREIILRAHQQNITGVSIRIVGGAALQIAYFDRPTTADLDAKIEPLDTVIAIAEEIARERDWPLDWLNDKATMFIPSWGRTVDWEPIFDDESVSISVAPIEALLAMKLLASASRPGRDTDDIVNLLRLNNIATIDDAEALFESFYPGDALAGRTIALLERIFSIGLPPAPPTPPRPDFN